MNQQKNKRPKELYKVDWVGKDNATIFSKGFTDQESAISFAKTVRFGIVLKLSGENKESMKWIIVPTKNAREFVKAVKLRKALEAKNPFLNADGVSETEVTTTTQVKASQNMRLISMFAFTPLVIYAGTRKDLPTWLRYSLFTVAGLNFLSNLKNFSTNRKIEKSIETLDETEE